MAAVGNHPIEADVTESTDTTRLAGNAAGLSAPHGSRPRPGHAVPDQVAVIGGGMVGLCVAWFLQDRGRRVTVFDRDHLTAGPTWAGAGSSWGNAGWLTPGLATPLPEPAVLRYGLRVLLRPDSPVYVPPVADLGLARFIAGFVRHSTTARWRTAMRALVPLTRAALGAFDELAAGGVTAPTRAAAPFLAGYRDRSGLDALLTELAEIRATGQPVDAEVLDPVAARDLEPLLSEQVRYVVSVQGQRFCDPGRFVAALADSVRERGGLVHEAMAIDEVREAGGRVELLGPGGPAGPYDAAVIATGAWLPRLARPFGVRLPVQAGRGYSFLVATEQPPSGPIYFPASRVACTPLRDGLRVAGMMEFRHPDAAADPRRIRAVVEATRGLLRGVDLDTRAAEWVGPRPCTPDGLPLIGPTISPRVFIAGGHGMWGITLGPVTGRLLADAIATGAPAAELSPFDPLR
ncbi:glycine/D-amino acid oxidase, deaminating [Frankia casuarinae]|nr:glycine/D-amino acid oxidase, deaminating [Frankia sp. CcI6]EYT92670.1 glycine/D-amino acid oxidase, deaminating [Frankia casuarinae]KFB05070.1 glycine/D-amino acid oxidase, deaminating [Frankia sp. Allo2]OAA25695.1 D-amino-acid dehydrogenase [Frankia casuarinae]TFE26024.1 FAD-dependent oxidoreductase [Frankia sp. B2]